MKSYTNIEQSKKLAKVLPLESADMYYYTVNGDLYKTPNIIESGDDLYVDEKSTPCWSLAALLKIIGHYTLQTVSDSKRVIVVSENGNPISSFSNPQPVDACYELILKLHELKLL